MSTPLPVTNGGGASSDDDDDMPPPDLEDMSEFVGAARSSHNLPLHD
jgi:hypothetical protein